MTLSNIASFSCYVQNSQHAEKPDILAPGENIRFEIFEEQVIYSGTSFAAPIVTGIIAQILTVCLSLAIYQDVMKTILTANIHNSTLRYTTEYADAADYEKCGAGLIDVRLALSAARAGRFLSRAFAAGTTPGTYRSHTFTVSASDTLTRVSLHLKNCHCALLFCNRKKVFLISKHRSTNAVIKQ